MNSRHNCFLTFYAYGNITYSNIDIIISLLELVVIKGGVRKFFVQKHF